jgi:type VI secretion system secreted protein VgrG
MSAAIDFLSITTPLATTSFAVSSVSGEEHLSRPYSYTVALHSGTALLDPNSLLDQAVTVTLGEPSGAGRYISGIACAVRQLPDSSGSLWRYQLTVVPKLWFLGQTQDCRFFQQMTVPDIVQTILGKFSVTYSSKLRGSYTARDYTVQFNESYLHFIQRLLEDEGIFYFFTHAAGSHTMVLADQNTAFQAIATPTVNLDENARGFGVLYSWHREDSTALGAVRVDDYNPQTGTPVPSGVTGSETTILKAKAASQRTHYTWPAVRGTTADTQTRAKWRMLAAEAAAQTFTGGGSVLDFVAGGKFTLMKDPMNGGGQTVYVIRSVAYEVSDTASGDGGAGGSHVSMSCLAFPAATAWHEVPALSPPVMAGLYSAQVIGPSGEEIYTDDSGRIQVQFPADNEGDITSDKTVWVRVIQPWAGVGWGAQFTPRIGMEVAVAFLEGDVNRPVVVGALYNSSNTPIFAAADKNKSGFRTHSTMNGGTGNYNELSFDDTMGSEVFLLHAEKDFTQEVENDKSVKVGKDETVTISGKKTDTVTGDHALTVSQGNHSITVSQGNQSTTVSQGNQSTTVSAGNLSTTVSQGNLSTTVSAGTITESAAQSVTLKVGDNSLVINTTGITLTVGGNSIAMTESGITLSGVQISISGQTQTSISGTMVSVKGDGMLELSGAVTMINS